MMGFAITRLKKARYWLYPSYEKLKQPFVFPPACTTPIVPGNLMNLQGGWRNPLKSHKNPSLASFPKKRALSPVSNCFVEIS